MVEPESKCKHYKRNCLVEAPCCKIFYPCKLCHDELYKGPKAQWCKTYRMYFEKVEKIRCVGCQLEQEPSEKCIGCAIQFGKYCCLKCKLYENDEKKAGDIYHCDECGMCRRGKAAYQKHCKKCGYCISLSSFDDHVCQDNKVESDCPVCLENLRYSTRYYQPLDCGHLIHVHCLKQYVKTSINCPICGRSIYKMPKEQIEYYDRLIEETKKELPEEVRDKKINILCHECMQKTENVPFHFYGGKCGSCGTYNTKII